ncbi:MAG: SDR family oxidoreductase [Propionibacteriaceae bacterium]
MTKPVAVVTGASSGIGAATARLLASQGWTVICAARRQERITALAAEIGGKAVVCDVSKTDDVAALTQAAGDRIDLLVNNAGGALGQEAHDIADLEKWDRMWQANVMGAARVTQALLPAVEAAEGTIVFITSTAAEAAYEGAGGYCGVKAAERMMANSLRLELNGRPIRVVEIVPGMVMTDEFSLTRFDGDQAKADAVYAGVPDPLVAEDIAECIRWAADQPAHVVIERLVVRPRSQAANHKVVRH